MSGLKSFAHRRVGHGFRSFRFHTVDHRLHGFGGVDRFGMANVGTAAGNAADPLSHLVMNEAGTGTKADSVIFSLPATDTAGMRLMESIEDEE